MCAYMYICVYVWSIYMKLCRISDLVKTERKKERKKERERESVCVYVCKCVCMMKGERGTL